MQHHSRTVVHSLVTPGLTLGEEGGDSRTSKPFALQTLKRCIDFRGSHLSLQLARRHGQTEGWLLAEGPGHQQPFIPHLLQTQHHLMEPDSTLTRMERRIISRGTQDKFTKEKPSCVVEGCLFVVNLTEHANDDSAQQEVCHETRRHYHILN